MTTTTQTDLILVGRPHQGRPHAQIYKSRSHVVRDWINHTCLVARNYDADSILHDIDDHIWIAMSDEERFGVALADLGDDLHALDVLESPEDYAGWMRPQRHNMPYGLVRGLAVELGWVVEEEEDEDDS